MQRRAAGGDFDVASNPDGRSLANRADRYTPLPRRPTPIPDRHTPLPHRLTPAPHRLSPYPNTVADAPPRRSRLWVILGVAALVSAAGVALAVGFSGDDPAPAASTPVAPSQVEPPPAPIEPAVAAPTNPADVGAPEATVATPAATGSPPERPIAKAPTKRPATKAHATKPPVKKPLAKTPPAVEKRPPACDVFEHPNGCPRS